MKHAVHATLALILLTFVLVTSAVSQTMGEAEQFSAGAIDMNHGRAGQILIDVDRWSTAADREKLVGSLMSEGSSDDLLKADLKYAQQRPGKDGGRDIVLVTDRPISFWEAVNRPRSIDYPFTLIQLHIKADGTGEGKLALATKITTDPDTKMIEIEDYAHQPISLVDVKAEPKK
jgi:hypothetical protein